MSEEQKCEPTGRQWDAALYDDKHSFVWKYGAEVVELLAPEAGERVLDLGCGTGHLTNKIAESGAEVVGIDLSPAMIDQARTLYPAIRFEVVDAQQFEFRESFDAVFSNAAIHWMKEQPRVAANIYRVLNPGGRFVAEFGGKGNIKALHGAVQSVLHTNGYLPEQGLKDWKYYPTIGEYATLLEQAGFRVTYALHFDRSTQLEGGEAGLRNWLRMFVGEYLNLVPEGDREKVIEEVESCLRPAAYRDGAWYADYRRIRIRAVKEDM